MRNGSPVFDNVVHVHTLRDDNVIEPEGRVTQNFFYRMLQEQKGSDYPYEEFASAWSPATVGEILFRPGSEIDYAMVQTVPMFDMYKDGLDAVERQYELAQLYPERVIFCGGTDPVLRGVSTAIHDVEHQIKDLGAKSIKFYTGHTRGRSWRMDDRNLAYPLFERMLENGVDIAQVHKGNPLGPEPLTLELEVFHGRSPLSALASPLPLAWERDTERGVVSERWRRRRPTIRSPLPLAGEVR